MDDERAIGEAAGRRRPLLALGWGDARLAAELVEGFSYGYGRLGLIMGSRGVFEPEQLTDGPLALVSSLASSCGDDPRGRNTHPIAEGEQ